VTLRIGTRGSAPAPFAALDSYREGVYVNFLAADEDPGRTREAYGTGVSTTNSGVTGSGHTRLVRRIGQRRPVRLDNLGKPVREEAADRGDGRRHRPLLGLLVQLDPLVVDAGRRIRRPPVPKAAPAVAFFAAATG
jgi:hypothetical protein